jgi:dienelactone hydrolase
MADVVLFHSALGLRPAITTLAEVFRADGHTVTAPDLYDGRVFDDLDAGIAERDRIGVDALITRATAAIEPLPAELTFVGLSMGTAPALLLGTTRPGTRGVALIQGALPLGAIGVGSWPDGIALQRHTSVDDPWHEQDAVDELTTAVPAALLDRHDYPGCDHLFLDDALPEYDADATIGLVTALRAWIDRR